MAYSTVQRVALASGLVLAVSLLLPKAFLSRGKRQEPPPAPEGESGPATPEPPGKTLFEGGVTLGVPGPRRPEISVKPARENRGDRVLGGASPTIPLASAGSGPAGSAAGLARNVCLRASRSRRPRTHPFVRSPFPLPLAGLTHLVTICSGALSQQGSQLGFPLWGFCVLSVVLLYQLKSAGRGYC